MFQMRINERTCEGCYTCAEYIGSEILLEVLLMTLRRGGRRCRADMMSMADRNGY